MRMREMMRLAGVWLVNGWAGQQQQQHHGEGVVSARQSRQ
jgi:hypothetical protein